jgi:hypothetical protein
MRGEGGRFLPGNPGGPGRPRKTVERAYLDELVGVVTAEKWRAIVERAVTDATAGDASARTWLSKHLLGDEPAALAGVLDELRAEVERLKDDDGGGIAVGAGGAGGGAGADREGGAA